MSEFCDVNLSIVNDVWIKQLHFRQRGWIARSHAHTHDHQTLLAQGSLMITIGDQWTIYKAPTIILVKKGEFHQLEALEDNTIAYCIHALREGENIVEDIPNESLMGML